MKAKEVKTSIPGYKPSLEERETIIRFNEADSYASVYTFNPALIRKLDKLEAEREEVTCEAYENINGIECCEFSIPKKWIKVNATRILSEEVKAKFAEQLRLAKLQKSASETR